MPQSLRAFFAKLPNAWGLIVIHAFAILAVVLYPPTVWGVLLAVAVYVLGMFGTTAGYHRYFSHKTFKTSRVGAFLLGWLAQASLQRGVLWWAAHHRHHHRYSDQPEDLHSPRQHGFAEAHVGWVISDAANTPDYNRVKDLAKVPELAWLDRWWWVPGMAWLATTGVVGGLLGGWSGALFGMAWGWVIPMVLLFHGTFTINSLSHTWGRRVYVTQDTSRNNALLAIITLGEGWHNNHHRYPSSCRQGFLWWQYDITFYALKALSWLGLVWDIKAPPQRILDERSPTSLPAVFTGAELAWAKGQAAVRVAELAAQRAATSSREARDRLGTALQSAKVGMRHAPARAWLAAEDARLRAVAAAEDARTRAIGAAADAHSRALDAAEDARQRAVAATSEAWRAAEEARGRAEATASDAWHTAEQAADRALDAAEQTRVRALKVASDAHVTAVQAHERALQALQDAQNALRAMEPAPAPA